MPTQQTIPQTPPEDLAQQRAATVTLTTYTKATDYTPDSRSDVIRTHHTCYNNTEQTVLKVSYESSLFADFLNLSDLNQ